MLLSTITDLMACACRIMSYVTRHISKFSSANNHLIVEMVLLGIAGDHLGKSSWRRKANRVLEREILRQNWPDGVNKEQSLHYSSVRPGGLPTSRYSPFADRSRPFGEA
jgi:hypothetical protein